MSMPKAFALVLAGAVVTACGAPAEAPKSEPAPAEPAKAPAAAATGTAAIGGKITFEGAPPPAEKVKLSADPKCAAMHKEGLEKQVVRVKDGGLADVFVYVKNVSGSYPAPAQPAVLDQNGCSYTPHVLGVQAGQSILIRNSDDTLHNIHPRPQVNEEFNIGQPRKGMESTKTFDKTEIMIPVGCDVHPWMRAYISVVPHPFFAVTGEDGAFSIKGLPAGEYEVEAVHEKLKGVTGKITVKDGETATLNLTFKG